MVELNFPKMRTILIFSYSPNSSSISFLRYQKETVLTNIPIGSCIQRSTFPLEYSCQKTLKKMMSHFEANPMWEFLHNEHGVHREKVLNKTYTHYKKKHNKSYEDALENHKRKNIFRHNSR